VADCLRGPGLFQHVQASALGLPQRGVERHIESYKQAGAHVRVTPHDCRLELLRFLALIPLARLDFRLDMHPQVTCSDASGGGGGICASVSTTAVGRRVAGGALRGQVPEAKVDGGVLVVGLFDGIGALRVALDTLGVPVLGYISVEKHEPARRVVERHYPGVLHYVTVQEITGEVVKGWSAKFSQAVWWCWARGLLAKGSVA